jgi:hypothetical protein
MADSLNFSTAFSGSVSRSEFEESLSYGIGSDTVSQMDKLTGWGTWLLNKTFFFTTHRTHKNCKQWGGGWGMKPPTERPAGDDVLPGRLWHEYGARVEWWQRKLGGSPAPLSLRLSRISHEVIRLWTLGSIVTSQCLTAWAGRLINLWHLRPIMYTWCSVISTGQYVVNN